jgi:crotonobetainyl-CoA:carnitine CoA-transferase CaiB-like acyl-CoA transferase
MNALALNGIKVLDISQVAAVPMCARHLADYGADVIHVENVQTGDSWRYLQAGHGDGPAGIPSDIPYNWEAFNRNKKSLALDLSRQEGQDIIYRLAKDADVFLTNLRLSERTKFNMGYETLNRINPKIVYGSVTGHGMNGPDKNMPAYDTTVYFARSGINHMLGSTGGALPIPRAALGDTVAAMSLAFGVMTALYARDREGGLGEGQAVDTSLLATGIYQLTFDMAAALATGEDEVAYRIASFEGTEAEVAEMERLADEAGTAVRRMVSFMRERAPNVMANTYETSDGRSIRFNCLNADRYWGKFCKLIGREDLEHDPRFATMALREENRRKIYHIVRRVFLTRTLEEWRPLIAEFPASHNQSLVDIMHDPQADANGFFPDYDHPTYGRMKIMASPVSLSKTPATLRDPAPEFGQHTEEILLEAGCTWEEIEALQNRGVIP